MGVLITGVYFYAATPAGAGFLKVVFRKKLIFVLYLAAAGDGATKQKETFHFPSNWFAAPPPPGPRTN